MRVDIIGNGASNCFAEPQGMVVACNVPQHDIQYSALALIDPKVVHYMHSSGWHPDCFVLCTPITLELIHKFRIPVHAEPSLCHKHRWSTGHCVVDLYKHREIHLWGMDSWFSDDLTSQVDAVIPRQRRANLNRHWHPIWHTLLDCAKDITVHIPQGRESKIQHDRLKVQHH